MRTRLIIVFLVPMAVVLLALGGAYAWSVARSVQQEASNQQLADLGYFLTGARQALRAGSPAVIEPELQRYGELYGTEVAVFDRSGTLWASGGPRPERVDEELAEQLSLALAGRRSEPAPTTLPWALGESVTVEPVFDDGSVIGAVALSASTEAPRSEILAHWAALVLVCALVLALLLFAVVRLANWVLRPMLRVDRAMAAIEHGEMHARIDDDTGPPEMRRMIRMFNQMAEEIERVISRQREFAMNASHELRNPLGALLMRVEYLSTGLDDAWEAEIEKTREEGRRMTRILDTLLSMARAGRADSEFAVVDLAELAEGRAAAWAEVAAERGVRLAVQSDGAVPSLTDRTSVESALDAVLDNALKFAPAGSAVEVSVRRDAEACSIAVRDHGPGLEAEELDRVTSRFWRSPRDQNVPGSGLGLAIASDLLDTLRGAVRVTAPEDGGLCVELRLPGEQP
ncbi:sensor histidine kinase [Leucobacter massiliensis]|uniref:histidine kinase n=1 Tax=Leucobacter massiliensis TaxID=1686285 RepID=A0A2S9QKX6_9MICO|nr:HAMP domain-containing sensor histidine kinase [Leucobacter massiliensis]PRI10232.1 two-component sensor histidine kinase [Leucobacter massiliensis]